MTPTPPEPAFAARVAGFPKARQGYARGPVDDFVADAQRHVDRLLAEAAALAAEVRQLTERLNDAEAKYERIRTADLDERAQDILAAAEEQARQIVADGQRVAAEKVEQARREAEVIFERGRQELAWHRRRLAAERAEAERRRYASESLQESARQPDTDVGEAAVDPQGGPDLGPGPGGHELPGEARAAAQQPG